MLRVHGNDLLVESAETNLLFLMLTVTSIRDGGGRKRQFVRSGEKFLIFNDDERAISVAEIFYDQDADLSLIQQRHVAVLGYGSQGHAHALSLRDSGVDVRVGLPEGSRSREAAASEGLRVTTPDQACEEADLIMVLAPDHVQRALYADAIAPGRKRRQNNSAGKKSRPTGAK